MVTGLLQVQCAGGLSIVLEHLKQDDSSGDFRQRFIEKNIMAEPGFEPKTFRLESSI